MKTAKEMIEAQKIIQAGHHKGAMIVLSDEAIEQLMEDYHEQFGEDEKRKEETPIFKIEIT